MLHFPFLWKSVSSACVWLAGRFVGQTPVVQRASAGMCDDEEEEEDEDDEYIFKTKFNLIYFHSIWKCLFKSQFVLSVKVTKHNY